MILYTPTPDYYNDYIAHHGVKGQKWGVKNGPPYPLNSEGKASFKRNNLGKGDIQKRKVNGKSNVDASKKLVPRETGNKAVDWINSHSKVRESRPGKAARFGELDRNGDIIRTRNQLIEEAAYRGVQEHKQRLKKAIDSEGDMLKDLFNAYEQNGDIESEKAYRKALKRVAKENGITRMSLEDELIKNIESTRDNISNNKPSHGIRGHKWGFGPAMRKIEQEQQKKTHLSSEDLKNIENAILKAPKIKDKPGVEYDNTKFNDYMNSQMEKILDKKTTVNKDIKEIANKANAVKNDIRLDENNRKYKKLKKELEKFIEINESDQSKFDQIYKNATDAHKKYYEYMEKQPTKGVSEALKNKKFNSIYDAKLLTEQRRIDYANELTNKFLKDNGIESNGKDNIHRLTYNIILDSLNVNSYDRLVKNRG